MGKHNIPYKFKNKRNNRQRCIACGNEIKDGEITIKRFDGKTNGHLMFQKASGHIQHAKELLTARGKPMYTDNDLKRMGLK